MKCKNIVLLVVALALFPLLSGCGRSGDRNLDLPYTGVSENFEVQDGAASGSVQEGTSENYSVKGILTNSPAGTSEGKSFILQGGPVAVSQ